MKKFALIGGAGYIAPRHVQAIQHTGNDLGAILDPYDGVGYIDKYFPNTSYFKQAELFDRHLYRHKNEYDYVAICSPNYLHDAHIRLALRNECNVICEKPLVLNTDHLDSLYELEQSTGNNINTILQLRYHDVIVDLKNKYKDTNKIHKVTLDYITPRGKWYDYSWKGDLGKSGGVTCNIGIHFFDMLIWIFGDVLDFNATNTITSSKGKILLEHAEVEYNLSINANDLPWKEWKPYRNITIDDTPLEFSEGFTELHNRSYEQILNGNGFGIKDVYPSIALVDKLKRI